MSVTNKGVLLNRYFDRRAQSSISSTPFFRLKSVQFGYGFLDTGTSPATVKDIPLTSVATDITNVYVDANPVFLYDAVTHQISLRTEIPAGAAGIPAGGVNVNAACVLDETGAAVAFLVGQLTVVNSSRGYVMTGVFETNIN